MPPKIFHLCCTISNNSSRQFYVDNLCIYHMLYQCLSSNLNSYKSQGNGNIIIVLQRAFKSKRDVDM